ncbi:MAG TPA: hypothetical protein VG604_04785 [Candidatus Saccharimonadales bacterium]|nr:hypothetical protein [Candidatus Saccharimonadales bacterium]
MLQQVRRSLGLNTKEKLAQETAEWKRAGNAALEAAGLTDSLGPLLERSIFAHAASRLALGFMLAEASKDTLYFVPTFSNYHYLRLRGEAAMLGAFFMQHPVSHAGVMCASPSRNFSEMDKEVVVTHELTHASFAMAGRYDESATIEGVEVSPEVLDEIEAYQNSGRVIAAHTSGSFYGLVDEMYGKMAAGNLDYPSKPYDLTGSVHADLVRSSSLTVLPTAYALAAAQLIGGGSMSTAELQRVTQFL